MAVIEVDHQDPVGPVDGEQPQDDVVDDERRDLRGFTRHVTSNRWLLLAAGQAVAVGLLLRPSARDSLVPYLLLFLAGSLVAIEAARSLSASGRGFLLLSGALLRATLLWRQPDLSDDVYRYLWDGRVARAGISPYADTPDDPALSNVDPALRARVAHRDMRTVYPPAAQAVFRALGGGGNLFLLKSFLAAADLAIVALLWSSGGGGGAFAAASVRVSPASRHRDRRGRPRRRAGSRSVVLEPAVRRLRSKSGLRARAGAFGHDEVRRHGRRAADPAAGKSGLRRLRSGSLVRSLAMGGARRHASGRSRSIRNAVGLQFGARIPPRCA